MNQLIRKTEKKKIIENPRGGEGTIELYEIFGSDETLGNVSLFAKVVLKPQTIIGFHEHHGEAEVYYVTKGKGFFIRNNQERIAVKAGDACMMEVGHGHGMENPNDEEMEIIAVVYPER